MTRMALPAGTDSISIPRITTGTDVDIQAADGTAIKNQDMVTTSVTAPVRTIAGEAVASQQLLDQSSLRQGIDQMIYQDLQAALDARVEYQVIQGSGLSGQMLGLTKTVGIGTVTSAAGTIAVGAFATAISQGLNAVASNRYLGAEAIAMIPSFWYALTGAVDGNGRPLVVPNQSGAFNALGVNTDPSGAQSFIGTFNGVPVVLAPQIANDTGYPVIIARFSDTFLMESGPRTRVVIGDTTGSQLQLRFQLWEYAAIAARYPSGIAKVTGVLKASGY